ncbi:hypothetical protein [Cupriavidus sp. UYPR2.512]|uniref:hypothetical protein n=1 Tax=Cupriavidus sp. UYPR2.512 TaxID=1080187 RepID=UPI0012F9112F|nr:hypothetical protein [Cupriavidus sp. UYPR2.512]UIF89434.1 hypothetical protein KAF44_29640 [Cupriavidus necator]
MSKWFKNWKVQAISATVGALVTAAAIAWMQPSDDYERTETGYATARLQSSSPSLEAIAGQKVVVDYFFYQCPHCRSFDPMLQAWAKGQAEGVAVKRVPVTGGRPVLIRQAALFYALDTLGEIPARNGAVFEAVANNADFPVSDTDLVKWAGKERIDPQRLLAAYHAPGIRARIEAGDQAFHDMALTTVPAISVRGRWIVTPATAGSIEAMAEAMTAAVKQPDPPGS